MAKALPAPAADDAPPAKAGPSMVVQIVVLLVMTLVAVGMGFASGAMLKPPPMEASAGEAAKDAEQAAAGGHGEEKKEEEEELEPPASLMPHAVNLPSVTTNLASPSDIWVRMELAVVFADAADPAMAETIHQDILAFMRTVKLHQVDSPSGFRHLKADLEDRARTRSAGKVTNVLIRTLLFE